MNWQALLDGGGGIGAVVLDAQYRVRAVSDSVLERSGWERGQMLGKSALDFVHPDDLPRGAATLQEAFIEHGDDREGMYRLSVGAGFEAFGLKVAHVPENRDGVRMSFFEVSETLRARELSEDLVRAVGLLSRGVSLDEVVQAVYLMVERQLPGVCLAATIFEPDGPSLVFPRYGFPEEMCNVNENANPLALPEHVALAVQNRRGSEWPLHSRLGSHEDQAPERAVFAMIDNDVAVGYLEAIRPWSTAPDAHEWLVYSSAAKVLEAAITRHRLDAALHRAANHDPLTGLLNRRGFEDAVNRSSESLGAVFVVDLDDFSWVNNELGHAAGDAALTTVASRLLEACPHGGVVARLGGDEFIGWIPGVENQTAQLIAQDVHSKMTTRFIYNDQSRQIRSSIGVVMLDTNEGIEQALRRADTAMYNAKSAGGSRVVYDVNTDIQEPLARA